MSGISFGSIDTKKHLMVVSDDLILRRKIEFDFIKDGLGKNELSIYLTHGDIKQLESDMANFGIDVHNYKKKGLLRVLNTGNPAEDALSFIDAVQAKIKTILPADGTLFRIVGRAMPNVGIEIAMAIQSRWEKILHTSMFEKLSGSILCTYDLTQIKANNEWSKWLDELKQNHHEYVICQNGKCNLVVNC